jgi:hypothetical protein
MAAMHQPLSRHLPYRRALTTTPLHRQRGQAMVYGLFVLISGLAALFYLFNVGQLSHEKTRLVNATDAVAYSAGLVEARTMNFAAYTNRALVANEVAIAQAVSMASWLEYAQSHGSTSSIGFNCLDEPSVPSVLVMIRYRFTCWFLASFESTGLTSNTKVAFDNLIPPLMAVTDLVKSSLQAGAAALPVLSLAARAQTMEQVAKANYNELGRVEVDHLQNSLVLRDDFAQYGSGNTKRMVMERFTRNDQGTDRRQRMADMAVRSVNLDEFMQRRSWSDRGLIAGCWWNWGGSRPRVDRSGRTRLENYDEWRASDRAVLTTYRSSFSWHRGWRCRSSASTIGYGDQSARTGSASTAIWQYSGISSFLELTSEALQSPDPRLVYAVQLRRPLDQTSTSEGRSAVRNSARINPYKAESVANDSLYSLAGVEVFFQRPTARVGDQTELPSLFNPYWQVHLVELPKDVQQKALVLLGVTGS